MTTNQIIGAVMITVVLSIVFLITVCTCGGVFRAIAVWACSILLTAMIVGGLILLCG